MAQHRVSFTDGSTNRASLSRIARVLLAVLALFVVMAAGGFYLDTSASASVAEPTLSISPPSGIRPLTATVTGSPCLSSITDALATTDVAPEPMEVRLAWQVNGNASTAQTRTISGVVDTIWQTSIVFDAANIGTNTVTASCHTPVGQLLMQYPPASVEVLPATPVLSISPVSIHVGESVTATADRCPDPDMPRLGGGYFVRFTLSYLTPPDGTQGSYSESIVTWSEENGTATATFHLPLNAPTQGGAYRVSAVCVLEELGYEAELFVYGSASLAVQGTAQPTSTPVVAPTPEPTATPAPTSTPGPTATPAPTATATPTPTSTPPPPTSTPNPTPTPGGIGIVFAG